MPELHDGTCCKETTSLTLVPPATTKSMQVSNPEFEHIPTEKGPPVTAAANHTSRRPPTGKHQHKAADPPEPPDAPQPPLSTMLAEVVGRRSWPRTTMDWAASLQRASTCPVRVTVKLTEGGSERADVDEEGASAHLGPDRARTSGRRLRRSSTSSRNHLPSPAAARRVRPPEEPAGAQIRACRCR